MDGETHRRRELGEFLRARRRQLVRADVGLPVVKGRIAHGLRREEISYLSGVSATWYTWLEQGREIRPSRQVLDALARTLRLSATEHSYILSLAGYSAPRPARPIPGTAPAGVQQLLRALSDYPAYVLAPDWALTGWTPAYTALYRDLGAVPAADRNLLWLVFTDPYLRELMPDWEFSSRRLLAQFRAGAGLRLGEASFSALVTRLREVSEPFRVGWESHDIEGFISRERLFRHPLVGDLHLEQHRLTPSDHPDLNLVVYTPVVTTEAPARLRKLLEIVSESAAGSPDREE
ncbi:helix-turn-helix transcriptional regulator [Pseudonocardia xinjiangensis]|uniref:Helix-turn-helix domain-containing protein n=1 Tax=Pseudonocardia xinjiangensis TaxID=75289 RepID=A0ABX1R6N5_9PSEU|nr:helix-turn-helix transcriptional regulator [Pseudonocardia xinjiangensis]NMH76063.1 helix-turn-helix domain-containing protein [Pseudonocardia xinjiangensis]